MSKNISVIGVGRLGICVALCLEKCGYNVLGVDVRENYVKQINNKTLNSPEPGVNKLLKESKNFKCTADFKEILNFSDVILIYVATPSSGGKKHYDHSTLSNILVTINSHKVENKEIVIGCTVMPGYTRDIANYLIQDCKNTNISYNPEFIAQGDIINGMENPDFILIGEGSEKSGDILEGIYKNLLKGNTVIRRMSPSSAEITKLAVNCFITTKIAFANMIGDVADLTEGANKYDIMKAVGTDSRIGCKYIRPGYGFGGPCFPRDNRALGSYIESIGIDPLIPIATDTSNKKHATFQTIQLINEKSKEYMFDGVGYKENCQVPIIEESQSLVIAENLALKGYTVALRDSKLLLDEVKKEYGGLFLYQEI